MAGDVTVWTSLPRVAADVVLASLLRFVFGGDIVPIGRFPAEFVRAVGPGALDGPTIGWGPSTISTSESESGPSVKSTTLSSTVSSTAFSASICAVAPKAQAFSSRALLSAAWCVYKTGVSLTMIIEHGHTSAANSRGDLFVGLLLAPPNLPPAPRTAFIRRRVSAASMAFWRAR